MYLTNLLLYSIVCYLTVLLSILGTEFLLADGTTWTPHSKNLIRVKNIMYAPRRIISSSILILRSTARRARSAISRLLLNGLLLMLSIVKAAAEFTFTISTKVMRASSRLCMTTTSKSKYLQEKRALDDACRTVTTYLLLTSPKDYHSGRRK